MRILSPFNTLTVLPVPASEQGGTPWRCNASYRVGIRKKVAVNGGAVRIFASAATSGGQ